VARLCWTTEHFGRGQKSRSPPVSLIVLHLNKHQTFNAPVAKFLREVLRFPASTTSRVPPDHPQNTNDKHVHGEERCRNGFQDF
jgi:hypothetical protein